MHTTGLNLQLSSSRQSDQWNGAGGARLGVTGTALPTDGWPRNKPRDLRANATRGGGGGRWSDRADHGFSLLHRSLARTTRRSGSLVCRPPATVCTWPHRSRRTGNGWVHETVGFCTAAAVGRPGQRQSLGSLPVKTHSSQCAVMSLFDFHGFLIMCDCTNLLNF